MPTERQKSGSQPPHAASRGCVGSAQYRARAVRTLGAALAGALMLFAAAPAKADHPPTNVQVTPGNKTLAVTWTRSSGDHYLRHKPKSTNSWNVRRITGTG